MSGSGIFRGHTISRRSKPEPGSNDVQPYDLVLERFNAWKDATKQLVLYFEGVADVEASSAKQISKLSGIVHTPFRPGNHFIEKGGLQTVFDSVREKTHLISEQHANFSRTITNNVVKHVQNIRDDIKTHIKDIENEVGKLSVRVDKEREQSKKLISDLAASITNMKTNPGGVTADKDPFIVNAHVRHQLQMQIHDENLLQKAVIIMQQNSEKIEGNIITGIQTAWKNFEEWEEKKATTVTGLQMAMANDFKSFSPDLEWNDFRERRKEVLIAPDTPLRDEEALKYPSMDDPAVEPAHKGMMERKKRYTRTYRDSFYVLTPAGYLHEYPSSDPSVAPNPLFSVFLPACTLGAQSSDSSKSHKFNLGEDKNKNGKSSLRSSLRLGKSEREWSFKSGNRGEMTEWWESIRPHCARHLQSIEADAEGKSTAASAVKNVGIKEEEEQDEAEGERTSTSGEYEDDETQPPNYPESDPGFAGVGAGGHAYTDDKKADPIEEAAEGAGAPDTVPAEAPAVASHTKEGTSESKFKEHM